MLQSHMTPRAGIVRLQLKLNPTFEQALLLRARVVRG